jgi:hypothetical protein
MSLKKILTMKSIKKDLKMPKIVIYGGKLSTSSKYEISLKVMKNFEFSFDLTKSP